MILYKGYEEKIISHFDENICFKELFVFEFFVHFFRSLFSHHLFEYGSDYLGPDFVTFFTRVRQAASETTNF